MAFYQHPRHNSIFPPYYPGNVRSDCKEMWYPHHPNVNNFVYPCTYDHLPCNTRIHHAPCPSRLDRIKFSRVAV